jgi:hypothetical protein
VGPASRARWGSSKAAWAFRVCATALSSLDGVFLDIWEAPRRRLRGISETYCVLFRILFFIPFVGGRAAGSGWVPGGCDGGGRRDRPQNQKKEGWFRDAANLRNFIPNWCEKAILESGGDSGGCGGCEKVSPGSKRGWGCEKVIPGSKWGWGCKKRCQASFLCAVLYGKCNLVCGLSM